MKSLESYSRLVSVQNLHSSRSKSKSPGSNRSYGSPNASPRLSHKFLGPHDCPPTPSPSREYQRQHTSHPAWDQEALDKQHTHDERYSRTTVCFAATDTCRSRNVHTHKFIHTLSHWQTKYANIHTHIYMYIYYNTQMHMAPAEMNMCTQFLFTDKTTLLSTRTFSDTLNPH